MKKLRGLFRVVFGRTAFVILFLLIQVGILFGVIRWLGDYLIYAYGLALIITSFAVIYILNARENASFKMAWIIPVLVFPVFGVLFFLFMHVQLRTRILKLRLKMTRKMAAPCLTQNAAVTDRLAKDDPSQFRLAGYMNRWAGFPVYENTSVCHFPLGEDKFEALKRELRAAKEFIFMEYFIIERGTMWNQILEILEQKVKEGVEVRVMYDGMCSLILLPYGYPKELEKKGIRCKMFSPIKPTLSTYQNNRDHRKIVVIDGRTAFTGGVNLADEYINAKVRFGHWKDTAVMIKGDAVTSFTMMFLQMWNVTEKEQDDYRAFLREPLPVEGGEGYVLPFGDSPMDNEQVGEQLYLDILNQAEDYVHIMTPYLILDDEMENALCFAAKRGVDVTLIMPHIPDKLYAYLLARTYYPELIEAGVKVYEYTPGFVHAKEFISDDSKAVVGTINLDFRSLYLHFECAAYIYKNPVVLEIERDFQATITKCKPVTLEECRRYPFLKRAAGRALRLFAPLM